MTTWEKRRLNFNGSERPKLAGKVPHRIELLLARAYMRGDLEGPLEEIEDKVFEQIYGIGPLTLVEIRKVIIFKETNNA